MFSSPLKINEQRNAEDDVQKLQQLSSAASTCLRDDENRLIDEIVAYSKQISLFAHEYDFDDVQANGFRTVLSVTVKILHRGLGNHHKSRKHREQFSSLLRSMVTAIDCLKVLREKTKASGVPLTTDKEFCVQVMQNYVKSGFESHEPILDTFAGVSFGKMGNCLIFIRNLLLMICCESSAAFVSSLFNSKLWYRNLDMHLRNFDLLTLKLLDKIFIISPVRFGAKLSAFFTNLPLGIPPWPRVVVVPRQLEFMITADPNNNPMFDVIRNSDRFHWGSDPIECLYCMKEPPASKEAPESVILDVHGGAFVSGCPELHLPYCQRWALQMPGVGVLQVRYTLCPDARFPVQVQQLLDTYMWLVSGSDSVRDALGFHPKKIILAGDSAGALFAMSAVIVLNEIRKKLHPELRMPVAVFSFYGAFSAAPLVTAATFTSPLHFLLLPNAMISASRCYRPDMERLSPPIQQISIPEIYHTLRNPEPNIFEQDSDLVLQELRKRDGIIDHPFICPIAYQDFDSLSDVQLHCTSTHSEPILDSTITMLKRWKGKASLTMMGDLVHGHLNSIGLSRQHDEAHEQTVHKFRAAFDLPAVHEPASAFRLFEYNLLSPGTLLGLIMLCYISMYCMTGANKEM